MTDEDINPELVRLREELTETKRRLRETESQLIHVYRSADASIDKASKEYLGASGVIMSLVVLGGREIFSPVCIRGGLSQATIDAIKADLRRSYEELAAMKPKGC